MIRKLAAAENEIVMPFLTKEPARNLFIIGDIYNNGYERDYQEIWGDFATDGALRAVLLRYYHHYIVAAYGGHGAEGFAEICRADSKFSNIAGLPENVQVYRRLLELGEPRKMHFTELKQLSAFGANDIMVEQATVADADAIAAMLSTISEFPDPSSPQHIINAINNRESRYFVVRENGKIVASAATTAENPYSAMIIGVACRADKRRKGYATACVRKLCETLLAENKTLCLFFDNPAAGSIYHKLGFKDIGYWMLIGK